MRRNVVGLVSAGPHHGCVATPISSGVWPPPTAVPWPIRVFVVDTMYLAREAWFLAHNPLCRSHLEETLDVGRSQAFIAGHVAGEMPRAIRRTGGGQDPSAALEIWHSRLSKRVRRVQLPLEAHLGPGIRGVLRHDADDIETAALVSFLEPCVLITTDTVFVANGLPAHPEPKQALSALTVLGRTEVSGYLGLTFTQLAAELFLKGAGLACTSAHRRPKDALIAALVLALGACALEVRRPGLTQQVARGTGHVLGTAGAQTVSAAGRMMDLHETAKTDVVEVKRIGRYSLAEAAAAILARTAGSMSVEKLRAELRLGRDCYTGPDEFDVSSVELPAVLRSHDAFTHSHRGWSLGEFDFDLAEIPR